MPRTEYQFCLNPFSTSLSTVKTGVVIEEVPLADVQEAFCAGKQEYGS